MVPNPLDIPAGCPFHPRCPELIPELCDVQTPPDTLLGQRHMVACHLYRREGR
jgi:oligopeptide/dipeptide ABC transporter ATP-binding protein